MIGCIYLLKSSEAERCILPDDAHRKPPARTDCAKTAPKSSSAQSGHLADQQNTTHMFQYCSAKAPLRFSASKAPPRRRPLAFAHVQNALSHLPVSKTPIQACMHPKRLSCLPETKAPLELACAQSLFMPSRVQSSTSQLLESKAPLHDCPHPKPLMSSRIQRSPRVRPSLKHPSCSPES